MRHTHLQLSHLGRFSTAPRFTQAASPPDALRAILFLHRHASHQAAPSPPRASRRSRSRHRRASRLSRFRPPPNDVAAEACHTPLAIRVRHAPLTADTVTSPPPSSSRDPTLPAPLLSLGPDPPARHAPHHGRSAATTPAAQIRLRLPPPSTDAPHVSRRCHRPPPTPRAPWQHVRAYHRHCRRPVSSLRAEALLPAAMSVAAPLRAKLSAEARRRRELEVRRLTASARPLALAATIGREARGASVSQRRTTSRSPLGPDLHREADPPWPLPPLPPCVRALPPTPRMLAPELAAFRPATVPATRGS